MVFFIFMVQEKSADIAGSIDCLSGEQGKEAGRFVLTFADKTSRGADSAILNLYFPSSLFSLEKGATSLCGSERTAFAGS
jgi:hypothetical protein